VRPLSDLFRHTMQLAYVTDDLDRACEFFERSLGTVETLKTYRSSLNGIVVVDGETAEEWLIDVALVNAGPTNFELIKPLSGSVELYRGAIRPGAPATFHHVGFRIPDFDEATDILAENGKSWKQFGFLPGAIKFGYVDLTEELGHYVELMELEPGGERHFAALEAKSDHR
jgi:Glyoxalase/Bleomycin resistance protein/Dioxygenase superfamily